MHYEMYCVRIMFIEYGIGVWVYEFRQFEDESKCQNYKNLNSKLISNKNETEGVELEMKSEIIEMNEQWSNSKLK